MKKSLICIVLAVLMLASFCSVYAEDIVVIFTNDVHCGVKDNWGYRGVASFKAAYEKTTPYVYLVDNGDAIQGDVYGAISQGEYIIDFMNAAGYDLAILGNHEFDYGMDRIAELADLAEFPYTDCNITYTGTKENKLDFLKPYVIEEFGEKKVAFVGVATPNAIATSTPTYFQEDGEFVYHFGAGEKGAIFYDLVQKAVDDARAEGADYVILLTHLGVRDSDAPYRSIDVINNTTGVDACLDGHSHSVIPMDMVANEEGVEIPLASTGTKLANIGVLTITEDGKISTELFPAIDDGTLTQNLLTAPFIYEIAEAVVDHLYEDQVEEVLASSNVDLWITDPDGVRIIRSRETNLGDLCADAYRAAAKADIAIVNGGGIRVNLKAGDLTFGDVKAVHPFGNTLYAVKATGQQILDALEWTSRNVQAEYKTPEGKALGENGGFLQVSGLRYTIDTSIESSVIADENNLYFGMIEGAPYRVTDVQVWDEEDKEWEELELDEEYTVASHNYLLKDGGDGTNMFMKDEIVLDAGIPDYKVLVDYVVSFDGDLSAYAEPQGRITIK